MKNSYILLLVILITIVGCRKDEHLMEVVPGVSEITEESKLTGLVVDVDGNAIADAVVTVGNKIKTTDENGVYYFESVDINSNGSLVKIVKLGFTPQFRFAANELGKLSYLNVQMIPEKTIAEFSSSVGGEFTIQNKSKVKFKPNAILNQDSSAYNGQVVLKGHWFDPFDESTVLNMPGDLRGVDKEGEKVQLATQGMFSLDIYDAQGNELLVGDDVELSFYVGDKGLDIDGSGTMPLWSLDEETGEWKEEGFSTLEGDYFVGEVSHFSFWNCDYPYPLACISGVIADINGVPIPNAEITIVVQNSLDCGMGTTNERGYFEAKVPAGVDLVLFVNGACEEGVAIGPLIEGVNDLGLIINNVETGSFIGKLLNCNDQPILNAYVFMQIGIKSKVFYSDQNGEVNGGFVFCDNAEWKVYAYDFVNKIQSDEIVLSMVNNYVDLGDVNLCNDIDEFIQFKMWGQDSHIFNPTEDNLQVLLLDGNLLVITNKVEIPTADNFLIAYSIDGSLPLNILKRKNSIPKYLNIEFTEIGNQVGDVITGSIQVEDDLELSFKLTINQTEESGTIITRIWDDTDQDGIQDANEIGKRPKSYVLRDIENPNTVFQTYVESYLLIEITNIIEFDNGDRIYFALKPDKYFKFLYGTTDPTVIQDDIEVSPANQGLDDTVDSDFYLIENSSPVRYQTDTFYLAPGQVETSYDLGIKEF